MTRTISANLDAHKQERVTTLTRCVKIKRTDGVIIGYTLFDSSLTIDLGDGDGSLTYTTVFSPMTSAIVSASGLQADNLSITGPLLEDSIDAQDLRNGKFDFAEVTIFECNWADLTQGVMIVFFGWWGPVEIKDYEFTVQFRPLTDAYSQHFGEIIQPSCRAELGDARCKIPLWLEEVERDTAYTASTVTGNPGSCVRAYQTVMSEEELIHNVYFECTTSGTTASTFVSYDPTIGNTTTDGTAVFTARNAWVRFGEVASVTNRRVFTATIDEPRAVDDWFSLGLIRWLTGENAGTYSEVKDWVQSSGTITMFLSQNFTPQVGDTFEISTGCDLRFEETCVAKFNNAINFRGEPHVPGADVALDYPDAQ